MSTDDPHAAVAEFKKPVNLSSKTLTAWLTTEQRPAGDIGDTHWRYSLMNWGHDPQAGKS